MNLTIWIISIYSSRILCLQGHVNVEGAAHTGRLRTNGNAARPLSSYVLATILKLNTWVLPTHEFPSILSTASELVRTWGSYWRCSAWSTWGCSRALSTRSWTTRRSSIWCLRRIANPSHLWVDRLSKESWKRRIWSDWHSATQGRIRWTAPRTSWDSTKTMATSSANTPSERWKILYDLEEEIKKIQKSTRQGQGWYWQPKKTYTS